jgi:putative acetyltransferase
VAVTIGIESPLQQDVRALIRALNAHLAPLSPREFQFQMTAEQMAEPGTTTFIARDGNGRAVGCGALRVHGPGLAEVKRMYTLPEVRGQGVARALLERIEALARERGIERLALETGNAPGFEAAWRLYERGGFSRCGALLDYPDSAWSAFFEKTLTVSEDA